MDESTKEATEGWRWFSRDFVLGQKRPEHRHADAQLLYAMRGVMLVKSGTVRRIITPNQALWIPAGTPHAIHFLSETAMRTFYFTKAPERMRVLRTLSITPLIRELTGTLFLKNLSTKTNGLMPALILQLVQEAPVTPADLALPAETGLRRTAEMILSKGLWNTPLEQFAAALNMTPVTFFAALSNRHRHDISGLAAPRAAHAVNGTARAGTHGQTDGAASRIFGPLRLYGRVQAPFRRHTHGTHAQPYKARGYLK